jgi:hypothetical protein
MGTKELHAGLIVIVPSVTPTIQRHLFGRAIAEASKITDMTNKVIEIEADRARVYELPKLFPAGNPTKLPPEEA